MANKENHQTNVRTQRKRNLQKGEGYAPHVMAYIQAREEWALKSGVIYENEFELSEQYMDFRAQEEMSRDEFDATDLVTKEAVASEKTGLLSPSGQMYYFMLYKRNKVQMFLGFLGVEDMELRGWIALENGHWRYLETWNRPVTDVQAEFIREWCERHQEVIPGFLDKQ